MIPFQIRDKVSATITMPADLGNVSRVFPYNKKLQSCTCKYILPHFALFLDLSEQSQCCACRSLEAIDYQRDCGNRNTCDYTDKDS